MPVLPITAAPPQIAPTGAQTGDTEALETRPDVEGPGHMVLSEDRLKWLVDRALLRIQEVSRECGRELDGNVRADSWMGELERNKQSYDRDLAWRAQMSGTIFADGMNLTWGASDGRVRLLAARVRDTLMGTRPFFGCMTARNGDPELTKAAEGYLQDRIDATNVPTAIRGAIRLALAINHVVMKTTLLVDKTPFVGPARGVFVDDTGDPVRTSKGELIYEKDDVIPDPNVQGLMRLKKDPSFSFIPGQYDSADFDSLEQELCHYDGAYSKAIDSRDFLCPLKVDSIHEADINVHLYHKTTAELGLSYWDVEQSRNYFAWRADSRVGAEKPIRIRGEDDDEGSWAIEKVFIAEVYMRCQIHDDQGDPREYEVILVLDVDNQKAIFYDYLGNHMSKRPFAVIPGVMKVDDRWYGIGVYTMMAHADMYTDAQLNRINQKDSRVASLRVKHQKAIKEWAAGEQVVFGTDKVYNFASDWDPEHDPIKQYNLMENADLGMELCREFRQAADNMFGIQSAAGASTLDQNRSDTATGINSLERDANLISRDNILDVGRAVEEVLWQAVEVELEHMDDTVVAFTPDGTKLATLDREEIRGLDKQVKLLLTRSRTSEGIAVMNQGEAVAMRYWGLPPVQRKAMRPLYVNQMRFLEIDDSDELLPEVTDEEIAAWQAAQKQPEPPKAPSKSIATKYTDLARSEQIQVLQQENIQPAPPDEIAAKQAQALASEVTVKEAAPPKPISDSHPAKPEPKN